METIRKKPLRKGVQKIFTEVSRTYEFVNHALSLGLDIHWRRKAARKAAEEGGSYWLDVCSGTGEMAINLSKLADKKVKIFSVDFCYLMLAKAAKKKSSSNINFTLAEANFLPFPDESFDLVAISFGTRNINPRREILDSHLREFYRVLKPGGRFVNLETSQPSLKMLQKLFFLYTRWIIKPIGFLLSGSKAGYSYLSFTIPRFYPPEEFSLILSKSGFTRISYSPLFFGTSAIHMAYK